LGGPDGCRGRKGGEDMDRTLLKKVLAGFSVAGLLAGTTLGLTGCAGRAHGS